MFFNRTSFLVAFYEREIIDLSFKFLRNASTAPYSSARAAEREKMMVFT